MNVFFEYAAAVAAVCGNKCETWCCQVSETLKSRLVHKLHGFCLIYILVFEKKADGLSSL